MADELTGEDLLRNVAPGFFDQDAEEPGAGCLWPGPRDDGKLSTDRASIRSPEESFLHRTEILGLDSRGVVTVAVDDLLEHCDAPTVADPLTAGVNGEEHDNPAHALSDFTKVKQYVNEQPKKERGKVREAMLDKLLDGSWAYGPVGG